jgi:hypothetical protein
MMRTNVAAIGSMFTQPFDAKIGRTKISWNEAKRLGRNGVCGEIRNEHDIAAVPRETVLRAVYIPDHAGGSIRWANPSYQSTVLSGNFHEHLACAGDPQLPTTQGFIVVRSDGTLVVANGS